MKRLVLLLACCFSVTVFASYELPSRQENTLNIRGEVSDQTCEVLVNGKPGSALILMPTVSASEFGGVGATVGETLFTIGVSNCTPPTSTLTISTWLLGGQHGARLGGILNTGTATNVEVEVGLAGGFEFTFYDNWVTPALELILEPGDTSASNTYAARYVSTGYPVITGTVSSTIQYAVSYL